MLGKIDESRSISHLIVITRTKINHDMALTSTRLQKGTKQNSPIKIKVIYSKFKEE